MTAGVHQLSGFGILKILFFGLKLNKCKNLTTQLLSCDTIFSCHEKIPPHSSSHKLAHLSSHSPLKSHFLKVLRCFQKKNLIIEVSWDQLGPVRKFTNLELCVLSTTISIRIINIEWPKVMILWWQVLQQYCSPEPAMILV